MMKKVMLLATVVAIMVCALALPAMANERWDTNDNSRWDTTNNWWYHDNDRNDDFGNAAAPVITQGFDQEADSGEVDQDFDVSGAGDNANQTVNVSGTANTGNIQDGFGFTQVGSEIDDFEIDGGGGSYLEVGGDSEVSSNQEVNQAALSGGRR